MSLSGVNITDEFDTPYGRFDNYSTVLGAFPSDATFTDTFSTPAIFPGSYYVGSGVNPFTVTYGASGRVVNKTTTSAWMMYKGNQYDNNQVVISSTQTVSGTINVKLAIKMDSANSTGLLLVDTGSSITIFKRAGGLDTSTGVSAPYVRSLNVKYWQVFKVSGSTLTGQIWNTNPNLGGSPVASVTVANLTTLGSTSQYVEGNRGFSGVAGMNHATVASGLNISSVVISPLVATIFSTNTLAQLTTFNRHADIRSFVNDTTTRAITQGELAQYHQWELAYTQTIAAAPAPTTGKFTLKWVNEKGAETDAHLDWNVSQATLQATIRSITGYTDTVVTGTTFPFTVKFAPDVAYMPLLGSSSDSLTASGAPVTLSITNANTDTFFLQTASDSDPELTQKDLQSIPSVSGENWVLTNFSTNSTPYLQTALVVGRTPSLGYWNALTLPLPTQFDGITLTSSMPAQPVNLASTISVDPTVIKIEVAVPGILTSCVDTSNLGSGLQFTSDPTGHFDNGQDSELIPFASTIQVGGGSPNRKMGFFLNTYLSNLDISRVTGARFILRGKAPAGGTFTAVNIRAFLADPAHFDVIAWQPVTADINTEMRAVTFPTSRLGDLGTATGSGYVKSIPLLRTSTLNPSNSPTISDGALSMKFKTGNLSAITTTNRLQLIFRENQVTNTSTKTTENFMVAELAFTSTFIGMKRYGVQRVRNTFPGTTYADTQIGGLVDDIQSAASAPSPGNKPVSGTFAPLKPNTNYLFQAEMQGTSFKGSIYELDDAGIINFTHYDTDFAIDPAWSFTTSGKAGWFVDINNQDLVIDYFRSSSTTYSVMRTVVFESRTPVVGARLETSSSNATQFFTSFGSTEGDPLEIDAGYSSENVVAWKFTGLGVNDNSGMESNGFQIDDWTNMSISLDIQVPGDMASNTLKRPYVYFVPLNTGGNVNATGTIGPISLSTVANSFVHNELDLSPYRFRNIGFYQVFIVSQIPHSSVWWVKNMRIEKRTVVWEMRAKTNGPWIPFNDMINDDHMAVHLGRDLRGTELQLQARALTDDAWISSYTLYPRYAELGRTVLL